MEGTLALIASSVGNLLLPTSIGCLDLRSVPSDLVAGDKPVPANLCCVQASAMDLGSQRRVCDPQDTRGVAEADERWLWVTHEH
jgi:hypothetical protein